MFKSTNSYCITFIIIYILHIRKNIYFLLFHIFLHTILHQLYFFSEGIPELDMPPLDPYFLEYQNTVYETGDLRADITVKNVNIYGLAKINFLAVRPHHSDDSFHLEVDLELPKMLIEGNFKAEGAYGVLTIGGEGVLIK